MAEGDTGICDRLTQSAGMKKIAAFGLELGGSRGLEQAGQWFTEGAMAARMLSPESSCR